MLNELQLQWIAHKAGESMVQDGNLDINLAASELKMAAEKLLALLKYPNMRPLQESFDWMVMTAAQQHQYQFKPVSA